MGFERAALFGIVEFDYLAPSGASGFLYTDLGVLGPGLAQRMVMTLPASSTRRIAKFRVPGSIKGKLYKVTVTAPGACYLYGGRVYARPLGAADAEWVWRDLPIPRTANEFSLFPLPVPKTAESFTEIRLPIPKTAEEYSAFPLPIPKTAEGWEQVNLPMRPTPELYEWVDVPVAP